MLRLMLKLASQLLSNNNRQLVISFEKGTFPFVFFFHFLFLFFFANKKPEKTHFVHFGFASMRAIHNNIEIMETIDSMASDDDLRKTMKMKNYSLLIETIV